MFTVENDKISYTCDKGMGCLGQANFDPCMFILLDLERLSLAQ